MNCWEILGIDPTSDHQKIRQAYEQQCKFASAEEARELARAYQEATGGSPEPEQTQAHASEPVDGQGEGPVQATNPGPALNSHDSQVVREVVIQITALLNDQIRSADANIWKAILCEPPADQSAIRGEIGQQLEPRIRPMAESGALPAPVARFLGDWFGWPGLGAAAEAPEQRMFPEPPVDGDTQEAPQGGGNIWVAMIGWIVGLAIVAAMFSQMGFQ